MNWRLKCLAFYALQVSPRAAYLFLQRRVTRRYLFTVTDADLDGYGFHVRNFQGGRALEFGAGSNLLTPLLLSAAGASEVLAYDVQAIATVEQVNHVIRQLPGRVPGNWAEVVSLDDLERLYRIRYMAPADIRDSGLPAGSVDFICSTSTLEHIPRAEIEAIMAECKRIASPNARLSFVIDYHDHYSTADPSIPRFNFYRYDDKVWRFFNPRNHYQNRLRHSDYESIFFSAFGFDPIVNYRVPAENDCRTLAAPFRRYSEDDLRALNGFFVLGPERR